MTIDELLGLADIEVDVASRALERVLERLRSLGPDGRARLRDALARAIADAEHDLARALDEQARRGAKLAEWRARREEAVRAAPHLVAEVDERIAELDHELPELAEYRAGLDELRRARALVEEACGVTG